MIYEIYVYRVDTFI